MSHLSTISISGMSNKSEYLRFFFLLTLLVILSKLLGKKKKLYKQKNKFCFFLLFPSVSFSKTNNSLEECVYPNSNNREEEKRTKYIVNYWMRCMHIRSIKCFQYKVEKIAWVTSNKSNTISISIRFDINIHFYYLIGACGQNKCKNYGLHNVVRCFYIKHIL